MEHLDLTPEQDALASSAAAQSWDTTGDGWADTVTVANADGSTQVFTDLDQNGVHEGAAVVRADGTVAAAFTDLDQNGILDIAVVDQTGNGVADTTAIDTDGNGVLDRLAYDLNENGVPDSQEGAPSVVRDGLVGGIAPLVVETVPPGTTGPGIVGPVTNPDPFYTLMLTLAAETGQAVFPPGDRDSDGWNDNEDHHPGDPFRH